MQKINVRVLCTHIIFLFSITSFILHSESHGSCSWRKIVFVMTVLHVLTLAIAIAALVLGVYIMMNYDHSSKNSMQSVSPTPSTLLPEQPLPCSSAPCVNQGTCINLHPSDYICTCAATYYGRNCEHGMSFYWYHINTKSSRYSHGTFCLRNLTSILGLGQTKDKAWFIPAKGATSIPCPKSVTDAAQGCTSGSYSNPIKS